MPTGSPQSSAVCSQCARPFEPTEEQLPHGGLRLAIVAHENSFLSLRPESLTLLLCHACAGDFWRRISSLSAMRSLHTSRDGTPCCEFWGRPEISVSPDRDGVMEVTITRVPKTQPVVVNDDIADTSNASSNNAHEPERGDPWWSVNLRLSRPAGFSADEIARLAEHDSLPPYVVASADAHGSSLSVAYAFRDTPPINDIFVVAVDHVTGMFPDARIEGVWVERALSPKE